MQLTQTIKLILNTQQKAMLTSAMAEYINAVNSLVSEATKGTSIQKYSSKDVNANLPSAIRAQIAQDARSIVKKHYKTCHKAVLKNKSLAMKNSTIRVTAPKLPMIKKPCCYINNQNFKLNGTNIEFPMMVNGKSKRVSIPTKMTDAQRMILSTAKLGTMRIVVKNNSIVAQIVYEANELTYKISGSAMGVDLGIKCPAVSYISDGKTKFYGNGRQNKYLRRHYKYLRKKMQSSKHPKAVEHINNKEQRIMKDIDHKISRSIVNEAIIHNVKTIKLEQLANIRSTTRTSRKNNHSLHTWSFYRLTQFIEYKAKIAGIMVEYVNPKYTSQTCPICGDIHHANDRQYTCKCGFTKHRDIVGAMNICSSTEVVGNRLSA